MLWAIILIIMGIPYRTNCWYAYLPIFSTLFSLTDSHVIEFKEAFSLFDKGAQ